MILEDRDGNDLVHHSGYHHRQMGTEAALVLGIMGRAGEAKMNEGVGIVAYDMGIAVARPVVALDVDLQVATIRGTRVPAHPIERAFAQQLFVAGAAKLAGVSIED